MLKILFSHTSAVHWIPQALSKPGITIGTGQQVECSLLAGAVCWAAFITLFPTRIICLNGNSPMSFTVYTLVLGIYEAWMCMMQLWIREADVYAMDWIWRALCLAVRVSCWSGLHPMLLAGAKVFIHCEAQDRAGLYWSLGWPQWGQHGSYWSNCVHSAQWNQIKTHGQNTSTWQPTCTKFRARLRLKCLYRNFTA